ncbi:MAG: GAF domain-containing protein, partial [Deltaproteobacteria bacterium]|nr:GAF domain-containing protein [Deltaproteobacteria bacterium]
LGGFDADRLEALATGILGASSSLEALVGRMMEVSGGLPGPAVAFVVAAAQHGTLVRRAHRWHVDEARLGGVPVGASAAAMALGADARAVGAVLAIHGVPMPVRALPPLAGLAPMVLRAAVAELEEAGLVAVEAGLARCRSRRDAEALRKLCPNPRRVHRLLLDYLRSQSDVPVDRLGWHAAGSRDPALAASLGPAAIAEAMAKDVHAAARLADALWEVAPVAELEGPRIDGLVVAGRVEEAERFGEQLLASRPPSERDIPIHVALVRLYAGFREDDEAAVATIQRARASLVDVPLPLELLAAEAQAHFRAGRLDEAIAVARSLGKIPGTSDPEEVDRWLGLRGVLAQCLHGKGDVEEAVALLERIPQRLGRGRAARATLDAIRGRLLWHAGRPREAREAMEEAARKDGGLSEIDRARILNNAGLAAYQTGDRLGALTLWEKALFLFERLDATVEQVRAQINLCVAYREAGRWERARQAGQWALARSSELGLAEYEAMAAGNLGDLYLAREAWEEADRWYGRAEAVAVRQDLQGELVELARRRAQLAVLRRDPGAETLAETARRVAAASAETRFEWCHATALLAVCHARSGHVAQLDELLAEAMTPLQEAGAQADLAEVRLWAAQAYLEAGRTEDALAEIPKVLLYADEVKHLLLRIRAERLGERARARAAGPSVLPMARFVQLAERLAAEQDLDVALGTLAQAALDMAGVDRAFVVLDEEQNLVVAAACAREGGEPGNPIMHIVNRAIQGKRKVVAADLRENGALLTTTSAVALKLSSVVCVPLLRDDVALGALYVDSHSLSEHELAELELVIRALAVQAVMVVTVARQKRTAEREAGRARELLGDLRTVLGSMALALETAQQDGAAAAARGMVEIAGRYLEGSPPPERELLAVAPVVAQYVSLFEIAAEHSAVPVTLVTKGEARVEMDPAGLGRCVVNLVAHAVGKSLAGAEVAVVLDSAIPPARRLRSWRSPTASRRNTAVLSARRAIHRAARC